MRQTSPFSSREDTDDLSMKSLELGEEIRRSKSLCRRMRI